jgi:2-polyprenyl-6-methoxyphenol hydroxylase-like FAD-dependent oxidoreductase
MDTKQADYTGFEQQHAVVIGGSMAGLLAARVLSAHFGQVSVIERDRFSHGEAPRKSVPQGQHVHVLLWGGAMVLMDLFPDLFSTMAQEGAPLVSSSEVRWHHFGVWKAAFPIERQAVYVSRPFLEQHVRACLAARENVHFIDACEVTGLNEQDGRVMGVFLRYRDEEPYKEMLPAALVIDASGRGSRTPQWLSFLGYDHVKEASIPVDVAYATRIYRLPDPLPCDWKTMSVYGTPPDERRGGFIYPIQGGYWMVTLVGMFGDYPPDDEAGFLDYAHSLAVPDLYEVMKEAEPVTPIVTYKYAANRRRYYERLSRLPAGFIIMGDALCSFNPIYGQGMSVAALEAKLLDTFLQDQRSRDLSGGKPGWTMRFQKALADVVQAPWRLASGDDFRYPQAQGKRLFGTRLFNWYMRRIHELMATNPLVTLRGYEVLQLLKPLSALFEPRIVWVVLSKALASRLQKPVPEAVMTTDEKHSRGNSSQTPVQSAVS